MIKVTANSYVKDGCVGEYLAIVKELVEKTNALDAGCIKYEQCKDVNDPLHFVMLEEWENQESLDNHMKAQHFVDLIPKMGALCSNPSNVAVLEKVY